MKISVDSFRGEAPRTSPRLLPVNGAQEATNCRMQTGDLEAWRQFLLTKTLANSGPVQTAYLLKDKWLSWNAQVDVARGVVAGDNTFRVYLTCPALYGMPRWTNYALATTGAEPFPVATRPLGVPGPTVAPLALAEQPDATSIALVNPGAEAGSMTGWTASTGAPAAYLGPDAATEYIVGQTGTGTHFFGGGAGALGASSAAFQDVNLAAVGIVESQALRLAWYQNAGMDAGQAGMTIQFYDASSHLLAGTVTAAQMTTTLVGVWEPREITAVVPTGAVTARLIQQYTRVPRLGVGYPTGARVEGYIDSITLNSVPYTNVFDGSTFDGWTVRPNVGTRGSSDTWCRAYIDGANGWPSPCFRLEGDTYRPYFYRNFSTDKSPAVTLQFDAYHANLARGIEVMLFARAADLAGTAIVFSQYGIWTARQTNLDNEGTKLADIAPGINFFGGRLTVTLTAKRVSGTSDATVTIRVVDPATTAVLVDNKTVNIPIDGPTVAFTARPGVLASEFLFDNINLTIAPPTPGVALTQTTSVATSYLYTFLSDWGDGTTQESSPSPPSKTVQRVEGEAMAVTMPTTTPIPGDAVTYSILWKRLYRAVTGSTGTAYLLVADKIPLSQAAYADTKTDKDIAGSDVLESDEWDLPPAGLEGIIALPNGIMAGFCRNELCLSAAGRPHAWPVRYRLAVDTDIVAISNIDNTIVIGTKSFLYTATGNSPDSYSMSKPGDPQACVSKRSMVFLPDVGGVGGGVGYASPDGWMLCTGSAGQVSNATNGIFTKRQWAALDPSSIIAAVHDGVLFFFFTGTAPDAGYALDTKTDGFGLIRLSFHATAVHVDPLTDSMHLVLDYNNEPTDAALPLASTAVVPNGLKLWQFDAGASAMVFRWRGRLNVTPYPLTLLVAQVRALSFDNLLVRVYGNGVVLYQKLLANAREFTLPALNAYDSYELELLGTSTVRTAQAAEDVMELA